MPSHTFPINLLKCDDDIISVERVPAMPKIIVHENESLEKALKRLKRKVEREGVLQGVKDRKYYEKPSEKRRRRRKIKKFW